jgi:alpha-galactosidase
MEMRLAKLILAEGLGSTGAPRAGLFSQGGRFRLTWTCLAVAGMALTAASAQPASSHVAQEQSATGSWMQKDLALDSATPPFSFLYGRHSSADLLKTWTRTDDAKRLDGGVDERTLRWNDSQTGLQVSAVMRRFADSPVIEWTIYFKDAGASDTPMLEQIHPLDITVPLLGKSIPTILYSKGCGVMDTYSLQKIRMNQLESFSLSNENGGKTVDSIPFFDIDNSGRGLIGAVGWPGRWALSFSRPTEGAISVNAGMKTTHLLLHPGEQIRTPTILLLAWQGDDADAHNLLRRHILAWHTPHYDGKPVVLPVSHLGWGGMKTSTSLRLIDQISAEKIGFENFWMDAGWYGTNRPVDEFQVFGKEDWFLHAGDWQVNQVPHPDGLGLRNISDAAHAKGMKFLLWFEPERAVVGTPVTVQHPDWFIGEVGTNFEGNTERPFVKFRMFNFGNPAARQFMTNWISDLITQQGIDIYRQDCNFALAPFWDQADQRDRQGMTEIRYVEGLLQFWDELRQRHPGLILDIVQRSDLDTISRAVDLSRADYPVSPDADPVGAQVSTEGLAYWRPHFGTLLQVRPSDSYHFRSGMAPGLAFALFNVAGTPDQVGKFISDDFPFEWMRTMVAQLKRARPYYYGDYYPILPCSANSDCEENPNLERSAAFEWAAWQWNRPDSGDGMVQVFRRDKNDQPARNLILRGLNPASQYQITDADAGKPQVVSGKALMETGLHVEIPDARGAAILFYQKIH